MKDELFNFEDQDLEEREQSRARCTPESLLEFLVDFEKREKRSPTLRECKDKFGGILGPMICAWKLERQGKLLNGRVVADDQRAIIPENDPERGE